MMTSGRRRLRNKHELAKIMVVAGFSVQRKPDFFYKNDGSL